MLWIAGQTMWRVDYKAFLAYRETFFTVLYRLSVEDHGRDYQIITNDWIPMDFFLCVIGMVMIIEGVPYFAAPDQMKRWMAKIKEMTPESLRRFGLVMMVLGLVLVYLGRR